MRILLSTLLLVPLSSTAGVRQGDPPPMKDLAAPSADAKPDAKTDELLAALATCAANTDKAERLAAYDALAKRLGVLPAVPGAWTVTASVSPIDDSKTVTLGLASEKEIAAGPGKSFEPQLVLRCKAGKLELYTITGVTTEEEKPDHKTSVTVRIGKEKAVPLRMERSTAGDALFWPDPAANIEKLLHADRLALQFTPKEFEAVVLEFDLRGLAEVHPQLAEACAKR